MPIYGDEKKLQMARSILPSKARGAARWRKAEIKRNNRRAINQKLHLAARDHEFVEEEDLTEFPDAELISAMWDRRGRDKLNHFERWAVEITADLPKEDRLGYMRSILPKNLIGDHALLHLRFRDEFAIDEFKYRRAGYHYYTKVQRELSREDKAQLLYDIIVDGRAHRMLNRLLRERHSGVRWVVRYEEYTDTRTRWVDGRPVFDSFKTLRAVYEKVGPEARYPTGIGDIYSFFDDISKAARGYSKITVPPYVQKIVKASGPGMDPIIDEKVETTRRNPDFHPEWATAFDLFLRCWLKHPQDYVALERALREGAATTFPRFGF